MLMLHETHLSSKPMDPEELEAAAELAQREQDAAISELKIDLAKNMLKVDNRQKTVLDSLRDLQMENKKNQQDNVRTLKDLKEKLHHEIEQVDGHAAKNQGALLQLINQQAELTSKRLREQDEKIDLLLSAVCGPVASMREGETPTAGEGGLLLSAINRRIEKLERQEHSEIMRIQELLEKGGASTDAHLDNIGHDIMNKVNGLEAILPKIYSDLSTALSKSENISTENFKALRSAIIEDMRPVLNDLDARVKRTEELQLKNQSHMQDNLGVIAGISPALAGIEARLAASAITLQTETRASVSYLYISVHVWM